MNTMKGGALTVRLTFVQRDHLLKCIRIAHEDESIFGGEVDGTPKFRTIENRGEILNKILRGEKS